MTESGNVVLAWLDRLFFGGMEFSFLSSPAFAAVVVLQERYPDAAALSGLCAIVAGAVAVAVFRSGYVDVGDWPRRAELSSLPLRFGYFSVVFFTATMGVAVVVVSTGSWWLTLLGGVVQVVGLAGFPTVYRTVYGEPLQKPAQRV